jgi:hypothetical protein
MIIIDRLLKYIIFMKSRVDNTTGIYAVLVAAEHHDSKLCAVCKSTPITGHAGPEGSRRSM